ncbi:MAG: AI-2E family transporter, partial [Planctomycetota bacterium]|nr:AI-2E family transporter [Planctomycetota bacterium]
MTERARPNVLLSLACVVVLVAGLQAAGSVLLPFLLSILLAVLAMPVVRWLQGMKIPATFAVLLTVCLLIALFTGVGVVVGTSVNDFSDKLPVYEELLREKIAELGQGTPLPELGDWFDPGAAFSFAGQILNGLVGVLSNLFLILLTTVFILLESAGIPSKLRAAFPGDGEPLTKASAVGRSVQAYLGVKTLMSLATGVCVALLVGALGLSHPALWGLIAFLLNFVPSIGSIIAAFPAVLLALVELGSGEALAILIGFVVINMVIGNVIEPRLMGRKLGLSPLVVFLSLLFWGWVWG